MIAHTRQLLVAVLVLVAVDVGVFAVRREPGAVELPSTPSFDPSAATSLHVTGPGDAVTLVRTGTGWALPDAPADPIEVDAVLAALAGGIHPDLRIGDTDHETYGLTGGDELRVEVDGASGRLSAFHVGHDAGGGATWIRLPDRDDVYRARIGGRARFDRPAGAWRDRRVTDLDPPAIDELTVTAAGQTLTAVRAAGGWTGSPDPVDGPTIDRLVAELAQLRAAEVVGGAGIEWDGAEIALRTKDDIVRLTFGSDGPLRYVRRADRDDLWRISVPWVDRLSDPSTFRDRAIWTASRVDRFVLHAPGREGILAREGDGWRIVRPANVDVDPARAEAVAAWLASPRVVGWGSTPVTFAGDHRWEITADGVQHQIELGPKDGDRQAIRVGDRVGWIEARVVQGVEGLFGG